MQLQDSRRLVAVTALVAALAASACAGGSMSLGAGSSGSPTPTTGGGGGGAGGDDDVSTLSAPGLQTLSNNTGDAAGQVLGAGGNLITALGAALEPEADTPIAPVQDLVSQTLTQLGGALNEQGGALSSDGLGGAPLVGSLVQTTLSSGDALASTLLNLQVNNTNVIGGADAQPLLSLNLQGNDPDPLGVLGAGVNNTEPLLATDLGGLADPLLGQVGVLDSTGTLGDLTAPLADPLGLGPSNSDAPIAPGPFAEVVAPVTQVTGGLVGGLGGLLGQ